MKPTVRKTSWSRRAFLSAAIACLAAPAYAQCRRTPSDSLGPYYVPVSGSEANLCRRDDSPGILVSGRIQAFPDCRPLAGALVEVWHADRRGRYSRVGDTRFDDADCLLRANVRTDENGRYTFRTLDPGEYTGRPRHIHFRISAPGFRTLVTQLYFDAQDGVGPLLVARPAQTGQGAARAYEFDVAIGPS